MDLSQLTKQEFEQFQSLIFQLSGIQVPENKVMLLSNRIRRRVKATRKESFQEYLLFLKSRSGKEELEGFLDSVTTNETSFFRTEKHFDWLRTDFVDDIREQVRQGRHPKSIRIWSAACSSGEEPYTIAMCLAENRLKLLHWKIEILGSDISETSMIKAREGVYGREVAQHVPEKWLGRYFDANEEDSTWTVKKQLRDMVSIHRHNLTEPNPQKEFDCIFIRNVLIYFSRESKKVVVDHLVRSLRNEGYLVVGPSEGIYDMLGMLEKRSPFLYQKASSGGHHG